MTGRLVTSWLGILTTVFLVGCSSDSNESGSNGAPDGGQHDGAAGSVDGSVDGSVEGSVEGSADVVDETALQDGDSAPVSPVEVPGPSAKLFAEHPYYTCVTDRYVATADNGGSDSADGTAPTVGGGHGPWLTLEHANASIPNPAPGYCIHLGDGTYAVPSSIVLDRGGDEASTTGFTVWRSMNLLGAKLEANGSTGNMLQAMASYLIFDGLELAGARTGTGINTCFNCCAYNGIHHVFVLNSYIHDMGENGVANCWSEYFWVIHNRLDENAYNSWNSGVSIYEPVEIPNYAPTPYDERWSPYHNVIAYNRCYGNFTSPQGSPHTDGNGIIYDDTRHEQNEPSVAYQPKALIMGNIAWGNGGFGIQVGPTSSNADVFNNTAYNNGLDTYNDGTWRGEISSAFGSGNTFRNNIAYAVVGTGIMENNAPYVGGNPLDATNSWASNIAFGNDPNMVAPDSFLTPDNMVDTDPMFVNLDAANYALQDGSPAIGSGEVVPFWQQQTPGAVDIGACAHGLTSCP